ASVHALEASPEALEVARHNAALHGVADRIDFLLSDGFAALAADTRFDLIVSNPPYIPTAEIASLQPEVRDHEPRGALDGGPDGMNFYRYLAAQSGGFLKASGRLMIELGDGQATAVSEIFGRQNWIVETVQKDYTHRPRIMIARRG